MRFITLDTPMMRWAYAYIVWLLIVITYQEYGNSEDGNLYGANIQDLADSPGRWVLVESDGRIIAGVIFRRFKGNKMRLVLHDNTREGKDALKKLFISEFEEGRCWGEVSGHLERILREHGLKPIPGTRAAEILGKPILELHPNGENYRRVVFTDPGTKEDMAKWEVLFGAVE